MKASILLLTILGMITINFVTGGPIEDPKHEASSENVIKNADVSDVDVLSRRKRSSCCWKVRVSYSETHHVQREQSKIFKYYFQQPGLVNGRVHYTSSDGDHAIWFGKNSHWDIGDVKNRGSTTANAHSGNSKPNCPSEVAYTWRYWNQDPDLWLDADKGLSIWCKS
jgi:hypothetical protein